jgi:hypothetical protein
MIRDELAEMAYESAMYKLHDLETTQFIKAIWDAIEVDEPPPPRKIEKELDIEWHDELKAMNEYAKKHTVRRIKEIKLNYRR